MRRILIILRKSWTMMTPEEEAMIVIMAITTLIAGMVLGLT